jgi:aminoglycoside phosphotransferase (APT) family kinase protein
MRTPGPLLASGRDADIFEYGPNLVLRRSRDRRSMAAEARIMEYLHAQGYPVPAVEEISADEADLVMERIQGRSMVDAIAHAPWTVRRQARVLAQLHHDLHEVAAPGFLPPAPVGPGDRILHLDLHPLNVIIGPKRAVVIDWTNACLGDPGVDVALAWILLSAGAVPGNGVMARVLGWGRSLLVNEFVSQFDQKQVASLLRPVVEWKVNDPNMSQPEVDAMWRLVERSGTQ